jgi:CubicO group peptidase (beta-lactamase class C family)
MAGFFIFKRIFTIVIVLIMSSAYANTDLETTLSNKINKHIESNYMPSAVLKVQSTKHNLNILKSYGDAKINTIYDLASISKVFTGIAIMGLIDQKILNLSDKLSEFTNGKKKLITLEMILRHRGGLRAANYLSDFTNDREQTWRNIFNVSLKETPGKKFIYSDIGFMILGRIVEKYYGSLDQYLKEKLALALNLENTSYGVADTALLERTAQTISLAELGLVHDPRSRKLGGIAGHAGVFSTIKNLHKVITMLKTCDEALIFSLMSKETCLSMTRSHTSLRGLGVDIESGYSNSLRGDYLSRESFGHSGYTGTSFWADKENDIVIILLTNRVRSGDDSLIKKKIIELRRFIANEVGKSVIGY